MKLLILRFSSIGDVLQCLSVAGAFGRDFPQAEVHWVTRDDLKPLIETHPQVKVVWSIRKGEGLKELRKLAKALRAQNFTHIYDAHNNLRSRLLCWLIWGPFQWRARIQGRKFLRRKIPRFKRFLLFRFRKNLFRQPFSGQRDLLEPLKIWGMPETAPPPPQLFIPPQARQEVVSKVPFDSYISLAPSAAYPLKRWPLKYWKELIERKPEWNFVVLGGPQDEFLGELVKVAPERVLNLAGRLSLVESAAVVERSRLLISNDTGVLHMAEQLGKKCIALMGPAPFGFPSREKTLILEKDLYCRPCSKHGQGPCVNPHFHKCLVDILPSTVAQKAQTWLEA